MKRRELRRPSCSTEYDSPMALLTARRTYAPVVQEELRQIALRYGLPPNTSREALQRVISRLPQQNGEREGLVDDDSGPSTSASVQRQQQHQQLQVPVQQQQQQQLPDAAEQQQQFVLTTTIDNGDQGGDRAVHSLDSLLRSLSSTGQLNTGAMVQDRRRAMTPNPQMVRRPQSAMEYERQFQVRYIGRIEYRPILRAPSSRRVLKPLAAPTGDAVGACQERGRESGWRGANSPTFPFLESRIYEPASHKCLG